MNNTTINESASPSTEQRGRNKVWTMDGTLPLHMAPLNEVPQQVVIFEQLDPVPPEPKKHTGRQLFLILCLLATSALAYLVFSGVVKF